MSAPERMAPERATFTEKDGFQAAGGWYPAEGIVEFVRADVHTALLADRDRLAALLKEAGEVFRLRQVYHETPVDRGGQDGPKGRARRAWLEAEAALLARLDQETNND